MDVHNQFQNSGHYYHICKSISLEERKSIQRSCFIACRVASVLCWWPITPLGAASLELLAACPICVRLTLEALRMEQIKRCSIAAASHSMRQRIVILRRHIGVLDNFQYIAYLSHSIYFLSIINNIFSFLVDNARAD